MRSHASLIAFNPRRLKGCNGMRSLATAGPRYLRGLVLLVLLVLVLPHPLLVLLLLLLFFLVSAQHIEKTWFMPCAH